jgi:hypothetical protein
MDPLIDAVAKGRSGDVHSLDAEVYGSKGIARDALRPRQPAPAPTRKNVPPSAAFSPGPGWSGPGQSPSEDGRTVDLYDLMRSAIPAISS